MGLNSFNDMLATIQAIENYKISSKKVLKKDYDLFCKEYLFDQVKGKPFGQSFCERFKITDPILSRISNDTARYHIEKLGYIE